MKVAEKVNDELHYFVNDNKGSPVLITDSSGNEIQRLSYGSFGEGNGEFTGYVKDSGTGLLYANARYYDADLGRFLETDPIPSGNPYAYAANNPLKYVDPDGKSGIVAYNTRVAPSYAGVGPSDLRTGFDFLLLEAGLPQN